MKLNTLELVPYKKGEHDSIINQIILDDQNHYVKQILERINKDNGQEFQFDKGYLVKLQEKIIGYLYFSPISNYRLYIEYSILKQERKKGYGTLLLEEATNYILDNYNIKQIMLDIDQSNLASMKTALSCGYNYDDETIGMNDRIEFVLDNPYFINKNK